MKRQMKSTSWQSAISKLGKEHTHKLPCLPQHASPKQLAKRQFQLSKARTDYNYMLTYIEPVPFSANVPKVEKFSPDYRALVAKVIAPMVENFKQVVLKLYSVQLAHDLPVNLIDSIKRKPEKFALEWYDTMQALSQERQSAKERAAAQANAVAATSVSTSVTPSVISPTKATPKPLLKALGNLAHVPGDIEKMVSGLAKVHADFSRDGPTSLLKSLLHETISTEAGRDFLRPSSEDDYEQLYQTLARPLALQVAPQDWMLGDERPCQQDWYFGYLQTAGFNTTLLQGLTPSTLAALLQKMPLTDAQFQAVLGDASVSLQRACEQRRLYVCDYEFLVGAKESEFRGLKRYLSTPIALFYWNPSPPPGYPPGAGVLQPIAIQLHQQHDIETAPIFTPNDSANAQDPNGLKWKLAKFIVNAMQAIHHESIAHFGSCHLAIEPAVLASHRQLAENHPLMVLLKPHFRFTLHLNTTARHNLIIPGGVVATNVGPAIESSWEKISQAFINRQFDDINPERLFDLRNVAKLPDFPFRDDTLLLWKAIKKYVAAYLRLYYENDAAVQQDSELQAWVNELVSPMHAGFRGMRGLRKLAEPNAAKQLFELDNLDYLIDIVAYLIYLAGPQHGSVNYAQYPLMSFGPCVMGTVYQPGPSRSTVLNEVDDCLPWYPPLDQVLYTFTFEYLLSNVQYDKFGHYPGTPSMPYFKDERVQEVLADFQEELALIEAEIRLRNRNRPVPYLFQMPSRLSNSVSI